METVVLTGIGAAALGYVVYTVWRGISGKAGCNCGSGGSCPQAGGSCDCRAGHRPK